MTRPLGAFALVVALGIGAFGALGMGGCGARLGDHDFNWTTGERPSRIGEGALQVRWSRLLTPSRRGAYLPIEGSLPAIDATRGHVYVGTSEGRLFAFDVSGRFLYRFELDTQIESALAVDADKDELFVGTDRGEIYVLDASRGLIKRVIQAGGSVRQEPIVTKDAIFVVTEAETVEAYARADGSVLWRYMREQGEDFLIAGHAGLTLSGNRLLTAFGDGTVVSLDAADGRPRWERDTSLDVPETSGGVPRYLDCDTTPVVIGNTAYVASFGGGVYSLDLANGSVNWRLPEWTGVTSLAAIEEDLLLVSADRGVARLDVQAKQVRWIHALSRGTFGRPVLTDDVVVMGESRGSLVALDLEHGEEVGRVDQGKGFHAVFRPLGETAYGMSNGGSLLALSIRP